MSNSARRAGRSARRIASAPKRAAELARRARSVRLATAMRARLCAPRSGSPPARSSRRRRRTAPWSRAGPRTAATASRTAAAAMLIEWAPISVERAHFLGDRERALEHLVQRACRACRRCSASRTASFIWPRICGSPSTIESSPLATRKACRAADAAFEHVGVRAQRRGRHAARCRPASRPPASTSARVGADVDLGAVAGRDDRDLARPRSRRVAERLQRRRQLLAARTRTGRADRAARSCG